MRQFFVAQTTNLFEFHCVSLSGALLGPF